MMDMDVSLGKQHLVNETYYYIRDGVGRLVKKVRQNTVTTRSSAAPVSWSKRPRTKCVVARSTAPASFDMDKRAREVRQNDHAKDGDVDGSFTSQLSSTNRQLAKAWLLSSCHRCAVARAEATGCGRGNVDLMPTGAMSEPDFSDKGAAKPLSMEFSQLPSLNARPYGPDIAILKAHKIDDITWSDMLDFLNVGGALNTMDRDMHELVDSLDVYELWELEEST